MTVSKFLNLLILLTCSISIGTAQQLALEVESSGTERRIFSATNINNNTLSATELAINAGTATNEAQGFITSFANSYSASPGYAGYFDLQGANTGIILRAPMASGNIRFLTGSSAIATNTRMIIDHLGNVGLGTDTPASKLQISNGNLYMSDQNSAVILTSSNGSCWSVQVNNSGSLTTTSTPCP